VSLIREPGDRTLSPSVFVRAGRPAHRPVTRYERVRIHSESDVRAVRRAGLPVSVFDSALSESLGYPLTFRPALIVAREVLPLVETRFRTIAFADAQAARSPSIEDHIVAMLWIDTLGARRIARENAVRLDPARLLRRILVEGAEDRAYRVRLDEFAPGLPVPFGVKAIPRVALERDDRREFPRRRKA
jgi:hypothetical protein